jgi:hypothetical protein
VADGAGIGGGARAARTQPSRDAYLIGGALTGEPNKAIEEYRAFQQIVNLAENYPNVVVNDISEGALGLTERTIRNLRPDLSNVVFMHGDALKLPQLHNADIFVVAPNPGLSLFGIEGLLPKVPKLADNVLGHQSRIFIATEQNVDNLFGILKGNFVVSGRTFGKYNGVKVGNVLINSSYFDYPVDRFNYLITIHGRLPR